MAGTVPDDLILGILSKQRLKSLQRFKCLSKTWYSTISDPQFSTKLPWMRPSVLISQNSKTFSTISIESLLTAKNKALTRLPLPWETEHINPLPRAENYLIGSCNGLVCVDHKSKSGREDFILWNPSTGKFRRLPRCSGVRRERYYQHYVWFGYDESIHDYKLVWVDYYRRETKLHVFTLKSNAWRRTDHCRFSEWGLSRKDIGFANPRIIGVLSNGAIHWRTRTRPDDGRVILALDLATENFEVLDFANCPFDPRVGGSCLAGVAGMSWQIVKEYGWQGTSLPNRGILKYYPILFSSGKEILAVFDRVCQEHIGPSFDSVLIKFRIEEGGEKMSCPEKLLEVTSRYACRNNMVLHMEESLVSLTYF